MGFEFRSEQERNPVPLNKANIEDVERFLDGILHGDDEHREWLKEATYNFFIHNLPIGEPRGSGTKDKLYAELEMMTNFLQDNGYIILYDNYKEIIRERERIAQLEETSNGFEQA